MRRCAKVDSGGRRCVKTPHRKGFHRSEEPHTGRMAATYRATWVRLWK